MKNDKCDCGCDKNGWRVVKDYSDLEYMCLDMTSGYCFDDGRKEEKGYSPLWGREIRFTSPSDGFTIGRRPYNYRRIILWSNDEFSENDVCGRDNFEMTEEEISEELSHMRTPHWEVFTKDGGEIPIDNVYESEEDLHEGIYNLDDFDFPPKWEGEIGRRIVNIKTLINNNLLQIRCRSYYR